MSALVNFERFVQGLVEGSIFRLLRSRIEPVEIKGAVLTSSDERLVGAEVADTAKPYRINANVRLTLGDDVKLAAFGLSGKLSGSVTARLDAEGAGTGTGELVIDDGKYKAYSRELAVDRGRLVFAGGPLADPGVDVERHRAEPFVRSVGRPVWGRPRTTGDKEDRSPDWLSGNQSLWR